MKLFREVNWSEVVRKAIEEYIRRLEEGEKIVPAEALMEEIMRMGVSPSDLEPMSGELRNIYIDPLGRRMEESRIYDTSIIIDMVKRGSKTRVPHVSIITVVKYPPAITFAENILYPTRKD